MSARPLVLALLVPVLGAACGADESDPATDTSFADTSADVATDTPADVATDTDDTPQNRWFIDDEEHPAAFQSLNCEMFGDALRLSAVDTGGMGSIQILLPAVPAADGDYTVVPNADPTALGATDIYLSIGRDRDDANQYVGQSGTVSVTVVTTDPQEINLSFDDVDGVTDGGATAVLSGDVGARAGMFVGACDFDDLTP